MKKPRIFKKDSPIFDVYFWLFMIAIVAFLIVMFLVGGTIYQFLYHLIYQRHGFIALSDDNSLMGFTYLLFLFLMGACVIYFHVREYLSPKKRKKTAVPLKSLIGAYMFFFVLPGLGMVWMLMPFARINDEILEYRGIFPPTHVVQHADIRILEFDHDEGADDSYSYVTIHIEDGREIRFRIDDDSAANLIIHSGNQVVCKGTSGFLYQKRFFVSGTTMQQRVAHRLAKRIRREAIGIPEGCSWLLRP